jgi:hypothetical protein
MAAWASQVLKLIGPLSKEATKFVAQYVATHPEAREAVLAKVKAAGKSIDALRRARTPAAKIEAKLAIVERFASTRADDPDAADVSRQWTQRAQQIRDALALAETQGGKAKSQILDRLAARTDALAAEAIESLIPGESPSAAEGASSDASLTTERDE